MDEPAGLMRSLLAHDALKGSGIAGSLHTHSRVGPPGLGKFPATTLVDRFLSISVYELKVL